MKQEITVTGMTCQNCVRHVSEALASIPGVNAPEVDLSSGRVSFETERPLPREQLAGVLDEAGYSLA